MVAPSNRFRARAAAATLAAALSLGFCELTLRLLGLPPWRREAASVPEPPTCVHDPEIGWVNRPGAHLLPAYAANGAPTRVTVWRDGSRASAPVEPRVGRPVVFVGCSYLFGFGVPDHETLGWRVQRAHPASRVLNYASPGYGTYQSLLRLERWARQAAEEPALVVYGFAGWHDERNVAETAWMRGLVEFSGRGHVASPFCTLGAGEALVRHAPEAWARWPLANTLRLVRLAQDAWDLREPRSSMRTAVTERLLVEMNELCRKRRWPFVVLFLEAREEPERSRWDRFFASRGIAWVDLTRPDSREPRYQVPGDGHPNGRLNELWARGFEAEMAFHLP